MQFFGFHLMPWPYMSKEWVENGASSWVTVSNEEGPVDRVFHAPTSPRARELLEAAPRLAVRT